MTESAPQMNRRTVPNVLSIAGTDPTGGAGIQADLKSFAAHRGYGMCVVTALVAQNTQGVREIHLPPVEFLRAQLDAVSDDVAIDAVKIGMLGTAEIIETVASWWDELCRTAERRPVLVVDPVMVATSGDRLLQAEAEQALKEFLHRADLITPNVPELALLAEAQPAVDNEHLLGQAQVVADAHSTIVLAKGGHLTGGDVVDTLVFPQDAQAQRPAPVSVSSPRIETTNTHGTGCSVSAAFATLAARGLSWGEALEEVKAWMNASLQGAQSLDVGQGHGPIHHFAQLWRD
ncbi:bifunctional hydroxymethylpyrimidine kinase/phosphomethylpyrimidine kinase [Nesterenkonia flava]|uniref:Bifunctional hydroxymethylpyrimidine kinase/phosphomethylpyrimidine kinase n=1 Tax=Nesterenkonia flava TaxID=469799 RepID=A0ABU1FXA7_9MICC|nr:bifunctional hydroxymethylpyrimidine kinase/phosphomethylpyrimidine kinase [Nesterenkonia flava]MDR5712796.1 bifunctional hydroxymethylpyrimidine kinase/phosphomethylpyrimidine kinase [Nesterenkonia flava]